jgi:hypothetical protein
MVGGLYFRRGEVDGENGCFFLKNIYIENCLI